MIKFNNIDEYINPFPPFTQIKLKQIRKIIRKTAPQAQEKISYRMPTFYLKGNLVHFAGYSKHIGFYPTPSAIKHFEKKLTNYKYSKGAIQFPLDKDLPIKLIENLVRFRVKENLKNK
jgi:uncharacterized protein YdhG (YjbR/CyaY superfamily)